MSSLRKCVFAWVLVAFTLSAYAASQTTLYVNGSCGDDSWSGTNQVCAFPDGPKRTIQAGLGASSTGDTIIVANGTYIGNGNRDLDDGGRDLVVRSESGDPGLCIIDCQGSSAVPHRAFILRGETVVEGFTLRDGFASRGGAIESLGASLTITDCQFIGNTAEFGGAIWFEGGSTMIERCSFLNNSGLASVTVQGGAVWIGGGGGLIESCMFSNNKVMGEENNGGALYIEAGDQVIIDCQFEGNTAGGLFWSCLAQGGAIYSGGSASVIDSVFRANGLNILGGCGGGDRALGGALYGSFSVIEGCSFVGNVSDGFNWTAGGAIYTSGPVRNCDFSGNRTSAEFDRGSGGAAVGRGPFTNCRFSENRAGDGGAVWSNSGGTFTNCLFVRNTALEIYGGALAMWGGSVIVNCTFVGNETGLRGSAVFGQNGVLVSNCIIKDHIGGPLDGVTLAYSCIDFAYPGVGVINQDPLFVNAASDFHLLPGSPAIDAGDNTALLGGVTTDFDGNLRFVDDPNTPNTGLPGNGYAEIVDMGAYEFQGEVCYADCDPSTGVGVLDLFDFLCFQNSFVSGESYACDCDTSTGPLVCDLFDFLCFQGAFVGGCP